MLGVPFRVKSLNYDHSRAENLFVGYSEDVVAHLESYCIRHAALSLEHNARKMAAYFWGPPGVGKTRAAKLIAEVLEVPFEVVSLSSAMMDDLVGTVEKPGLLLSAISRVQPEMGGVRNMILLFDDVDRILNGAGANVWADQILNFLLTLLESETKSFYSPYLKAHVDISHLGIILAGNNLLRDKALSNRLDMVHFDGYSHEYKQNVVFQEMLPEIMALYKNTQHPLLDEDITDQDRENMIKIVYDDEDPGFRTIKMLVMKYLENRVRCKYYGKESDSSCMSKTLSMLTSQQRSKRGNSSEDEMLRSVLIARGYYTKEELSALEASGMTITEIGEATMKAIQEQEKHMGDTKSSVPQDAAALMK